MSRILEDDGLEEEDAPQSQHVQCNSNSKQQRIIASPSRLSKVRRRGSPARPENQQNHHQKEDTENETPRLWKDGSSVEQNVARRQQQNQRRVSFTQQAQAPQQQRLSYIGMQEQTPRPTIRQEWVYDNHSEAIEIVENPQQVNVDEGKEASAKKLQQTSGAPHTTTSRKPPAIRAAPLPPPTSMMSPPRPVMSRTHAHMELMTSDKIYQAPTQLHDISYKAKNVDDLMEFFHAPNVRGRDLSSAAARKDEKGKIPMHVFSENHSLAASIFTPVEADDERFPQVLHQISSFGREQHSNDKKLTKFLLEALLSANPKGVTWKDNDGFIPFERSLVLWTRRIYSIKQERSNRTLNSYSRRKSVTTETLQNMWASTTMSVSSAMTWAGKSLQFQTNPLNDDDEASGMEDGTLAEGTVIDPGAPIHFPTSSVRLTSLVRCSIKILSLILDELDERVAKGSNRSLLQGRQEAPMQSEAMDSLRSFCQSESSGHIAKALVEQIAKIPNLLLAILLLEDDFDREWALNSTLFQRIAVHHCSVDQWINATLQNADKGIARRGLDYLRHVSDIVESSKGNAGDEQDDFLEAISQLEGFIPSLLALEERQIEEAATTFIVRSVLDKMISKPFAVSVVFFDFFFLCVLMVGFRYSVNCFLLGQSPETVLKWIYVANSGIFYFAIRDLGKGITLLERTRQASIYLWSFWNIVEVLSTVLALTSTIAIRINFSDDIDFANIDPLRAFLAVTTGCLWLRALSLLKSLNVQLATFVLAILQILQDILWFLVILGALVSCFAQMFYTLLLPSTCATEGADRSDPQCYQSEYYLRLYTILGNLGDFDQFDRETFRTVFSVFLLVFFSFMVVIILLNILIAIVSDSYEKCLVRSHYLFGRARVLLIAELVSFQNLLRIQPSLQQNDLENARWWRRYLWNPGWSRGSISFFCLSVFVIFLWMMGELAGSYYGERYGSLVFSFLSVLVNVLLFAAIMVFLRRGAADSTSTDGDTLANSRWYDFFQQGMFRLLGTSQATAALGGEPDEWRGRLNYLQQEMERIAEKTNGSVVDQLKGMEQHVAISESQVRSEMSHLEGGMSNIMTELREMEKRNLEAMQQVLDAVSGPLQPRKPFSRPR